MDGNNEVPLTLQNMECDIGCNCGWEGIVCAPASSGFVSEQAVCPVRDDKTCQDFGCGDMFLNFGKNEAIDLFACDCCSTSLECGAYAPSVENLNFLPLHNTTVTRNDAALIISTFDILYSILFLLMWKFIGRKVQVIMRQVSGERRATSDERACRKVMVN